MEPGLFSTLRQPLYCRTHSICPDSPPTCNSSPWRATGKVSEEMVKVSTPTRVRSIGGEPGTNGQHSFYQLLHQGTSVVSCDIVVVARAQVGLGNQQDILVANALAQASVLSLGLNANQLAESGCSSGTCPTQGDARVIAPVTVIMFPELTPHMLGMLISLYEHSVFVQGVIWGINSFDQWGVELGKKVATGITEAFESRDLVKNFDPSTQESIESYLQLRRSY